MGLGMLTARSDQLAFIQTCLALDPQLEALRKRVPPLLAQAIETGELTAVVGRQGVIAALSAKPLYHVDPQIAQQINAQGLAEAWGLQGLSVHIGRFEDHWGLQEIDLPEVDGPLTVRVDARGFCQASPDANQQIRQILRQQLDSLGHFERIQEWYAGSGNLTGLLPGRAVRVRAIESDLQACERLQRSLDQAAVQNVDVVCSPVEQALSPPRGRELWLLDPGRQGARELAEYAQMSPPDALIYVSCALDTLGRDLAILRQGGLRIVHAALVDAFPWTVHAEAVVTLLRDPQG
jgi:tRNA/tmRNA/rRNA uracil-C5-methylase (TrmA/RlmC/RlmD family)